MPKVTPLPDPIDYDNICPIVYALSIIGQKWKIPILWHLAAEARWNMTVHTVKEMGVCRLSFFSL
jgi:DNA-binding HxlR family transcriptional regulator